MDYRPSSQYAHGGEKKVHALKEVDIIFTSNIVQSSSDSSPKLFRMIIFMSIPKEGPRNMFETPSTLQEHAPYYL